MSKATPPKAAGSAAPAAGPDAPAATAGPTLTVVAKIDGFRRAGRRWPTTATTVPAADFTKAQIAALKAEPNLVVATAD